MSQLTSRLRNDLLTGRYVPGQRLPEIPLAKKLGVRRGQMRAALKQLVYEGLLESEPNRGVSVASGIPGEVRQLLWPMRMQLETYALQCCFDDLAPSDFLYWNKMMKKLQVACEERDYSAVLDIDVNFHRSIMMRAGIENLLPIWSLIINQCLPGLNQIERSMDFIGHVYADHMKLLAVVEKGDKEMALLALHKHIMDGEANRKRGNRIYKERKSKHI